MKVSELSGHLLDFWVAKAGGGYREVSPRLANNYSITPYSSIWAEGGPIIEREHIRVIEVPEGWTRQRFYQADIPGNWSLQNGATYLEAAMRSYVMSKFGTEVPDE